MSAQQFFVILTLVKRFLNITLILCALVFATGCPGNHEPEQKRMVLLYVAATDASLSSYAEGNVADLIKGHVPSKNSSGEELLVFFQNRDNSTDTKRSDATLSRYYTNKSGQVIREELINFGSDFNACSAESFERVLAAAEAQCSPTYRVLMFSSHGTGWLPSGYYRSGESIRSCGDEVSAATPGAVRESIGYDSPTKDELDICDFASIMGKYHWEALLMDCCLMSTVEALYQLRSCCDWIVASPMEILIDGFPYSELLDPLFLDPGRSGLETICEKYYDYYQSRQGVYQSATIALVKCGELDNVASVAADIVALRRTEMESVYRSGVQKYYTLSHDWFFDFAHYFEQFSTEAQYEALTAALESAVPFKRATESAYGIAIDHYSGLSIYIPKDSYTALNAYYKQLEWNQRVKIIE